MALLAEILDLLRSGDEVLDRLDRLTAVIDAHREKSMQLYSQHCRPKLHHMGHVPEDIERAGLNRSRFKNERDMKIPKEVGQRAFKQFDQAVAHHVFNVFVEGVMQDDAFSEMSLGWPRKLIGGELWKAQSFDGPSGSLHAGDMVHWNQAGTCMIGTALHFIEHGGAYFGKVARHVHMLL